jgi:hypothetical protein
MAVVVVAMLEHTKTKQGKWTAYTARRERALMAKLARKAALRVRLGLLFMSIIATIAIRVITKTKQGKRDA